MRRGSLGQLWGAVFLSPGRGGGPEAATCGGGGGGGGWTEPGGEGAEPEGGWQQPPFHRPRRGWAPGPWAGRGWRAAGSPGSCWLQGCWRQQEQPPPPWETIIHKICKWHNYCYLFCGYECLKCKCQVWELSFSTPVPTRTVLEGGEGGCIPASPLGAPLGARGAGLGFAARAAS